MKVKPFSFNRFVVTLRRAACAFAILPGLALGPRVASAVVPAAVAIPGKPDFFMGTYDIGAQGYALKEFFVSGTAVSYTLDNATNANDEPCARPAKNAFYKTRIVVLVPTDPAKFNGTVVVEWLNVSGGNDVPVDWIILHRELIRQGYAYIGVSAQKAGIDGGVSLGGSAAEPLKKADPARYGSLVHPGDAYSYDIFSNVGRLLRSHPKTILGTLKPKHILAVGESQSAFYLTTYVNDVDPLVQVYDGFLIHSRAGNAAALDGESIFQMTPAQMNEVVQLRSNLRVPVLQFITETDLTHLGNSIGYYAARQPDNVHLRTWEIAGAAHGDSYVLGGVGMIDTAQTPVSQLAAAWEPMSEFRGMKLPVPFNNGPQHHYVAEAALAQLNEWVATGNAPPESTHITLQPSPHPSLVLDTNGNALGGVRTPWVDVPTSRLSGVGSLFGSTAPYDKAMLDQLYPGGREEYLRKFKVSLDSAIQSGFILSEDRQEILELASLTYPQSTPPHNQTP